MVDEADALSTIGMMSADRLSLAQALSSSGASATQGGSEGESMCSSGTTDVMMGRSGDTSDLTLSSSSTSTSSSSSSLSWEETVKALGRPAAVDVREGDVSVVSTDEEEYVDGMVVNDDIVFDSLIMDKVLDD